MVQFNQDKQSFLHKQKLQERVKELECLFAVATILVDSEISIQSGMELIASAVARSFSEPADTHVDITYKEYRYLLGKWDDTVASICESLNDGDKKVGYIKVGTSHSLGEGEDPILPEEKQLLMAVANITSAVIHRINTQKSLNRASEELKGKNAALREILFQIESEKQRYLQSIQLSIEGKLFPFIQEKADIPFEELQHLLNVLNEDVKKLDFQNQTDLPEILSVLSPREYQVSKYIKAGMSNKEIGEVIGVSPTTIEKHRHSIRKKLKLTNTNINLSTFLRNLTLYE